MNLNGNILDATGREVFTAGGPDAWLTTTYRGYIVILEWLVGAQSTEPMMVLRSVRATNTDGSLGICLSSIGAYADPSGGPAEGAIARCFDALDGLGRNVNGLEARNLLDVVIRFAPDLINMPPVPKIVRERELAVGRKVAEVEVKDEASGRVINERAL